MAIVVARRRSWGALKLKPSLRGRLLSLPQKMASRAKQEGVVGMTRWACAHLETLRREWQLGINTRGFIAPEELGYATDSPGYDPIPFVCIDAALDSLVLDSQRDVFVDIGSGLGRAVFVAANRPFRRVLGIELNRELVEQARQQLARARKRLLCQQVELVEADAASFLYPSDMSVVFLWNPFLGKILQRVMDRIRQSYLESPRAMTLLYALPEDQEDTLQALSWLVRRREIPTRFRTGIRIVAYDVNPD